MTPQEERNKRFDEKFVLNIPNRSVTGRDKKIKSFLQSEIDLEIAQFIDQEINWLEKEIDYIQKHSKGNYADGKVEAFTENIAHLTSLKELIK